MVNKEQFINGVVSYVDNEVIPQLPTIGKWGLGTITTLALAKADKIYDNLSENEALKTIGVFNDNMIDDELLFTALVDNAKKHGNIEVDLPLNLGKMRFNEDDVKRLHEYISNK